MKYPSEHEGYTEPQPMFVRQSDIEGISYNERKGRERRQWTRRKGSRIGRRNYDTISQAPEGRRSGKGRRKGLPENPSPFAEEVLSPLTLVEPAD